MWQPYANNMKVSFVKYVNCIPGHMVDTIGLKSGT